MQLSFPRRKTVRLKGYDYSNAGSYFITICVKNRRKLLSDIVNEKVELTSIGEIIDKIIRKIADSFNNISVDSFIIMPEHIHLLIKIESPSNKTGLGEVVRVIKAKSTRIIRDKENPGFNWQRNYYERIIRNKKEFENFRRYIKNNPVKYNSS